MGKMSLLSLTSKYSLNILCWCHYWSHWQMLAPNCKFASRTRVFNVPEHSHHFWHSRRCINEKRLGYVWWTNPKTYTHLVFIHAKSSVCPVASQGSCLQAVASGYILFLSCGSVISTHGVQVPVAGERERLAELVSIPLLTAHGPELTGDMCKGEEDERGPHKHRAALLLHGHFILFISLLWTLPRIWWLAVISKPVFLALVSGIFSAFQNCC